MNQGIRHNQGKPQWSQIDFKALEPMVRVLEQGGERVGRDNWKKGLLVRETIESLLRHTFALLAGENNDQESKQPHIGHILSNAMFISYMLQNRPDMDNRREKKESSAKDARGPVRWGRLNLDQEQIKESGMLNESSFRQIAQDFYNRWKDYREEYPKIANPMPKYPSKDIVSRANGVYAQAYHDQNANIGRSYPKDPQVNILHCLLNEGGFDPSDSRPIMDEILTEKISISGAPYNHKTIHLPKGITMRDALFRLEYYRRSA